MVEKSVYKSVPGILRPFKEYCQSIGISENDQIAYYGCSGTCTPFVELLAIGIRGLKAEQVFVPLLDEKKAKKLQNVQDIGMQVIGGPAELHPKAMVIMGGLAMPDVPVKKEEVRDIIQKHKPAKVIGVCFMSMFEKAGWLDTVSFDLTIDATIDPVTVIKK